MLTKNTQQEWLNYSSYRVLVHKVYVSFKLGSNSGLFIKRIFESELLQDLRLRKHLFSNRYSIHRPGNEINWILF